MYIPFECAGYMCYEKLIPENVCEIIDSNNKLTYICIKCRKIMEAKGSIYLKGERTGYPLFDIK